jgi:RimJ/RimL family protein N-acetyltransferase
LFPFLQCFGIRFHIVGKAQEQALSTARLSLGPIEARDASLIHEWRNDQEIQRMSSDEEYSETMQQSEERVQRWIDSDPNEIIHFAIRLKREGTLIGFAHLAMIDRRHGRCHLGIVIGDKKRWGHGFGTEACRALLRYAFHVLTLRRVAAETYSTNPRSVRMLERAGFKREGVLRENLLKDGPVDEYLYGMLAHDLT